MSKKLIILSMLLAITMLSACDSDDLAATNTPQNKSAQATLPLPVQVQEQASAPLASQETAPPLTGEALYTSDKAPDSMLYDKPQQVIDGVWSAIGSFAPARYENSGHNNNLSFIVTSDGVLVVNAGANYLLAKALHTEIKKITDFVVLENAQGHAMLGSNYWQEQGATVIAHEDAVQEIKDTSFAVFEEMKRVMKEKADGTKVSLPDESFKHKKVIEMGGVRFELIHLGPTHSPGDIVVWLPQKRLVVSGDMAFHQRMLPLFEYTDTAAWLKTWDKFAALGAEYVIPGHGEATNMAEVTRYTRDYLVYLRKKVAELIENGGTLQDAYEIDQSAYINLPTAEFLARRNAGQVFQSMEFE